MPPGRKRPAKDDDRLPCKYGSKCYRKNTDHLKRFRHPEPKELECDASISEDAPTIDRSPDVAHVPSSPKKLKPAAKKPDVSTSETKVEAKEPNDLPDSPDDVRESIKQKFLVEMPEDFYDFWEFCTSLKKECPSDALHDLLGLKLVGPFDVLAGKLTNKSVRTSDDFLCHWRYFYDPPEMQTVLSRDDETMYHIGYFRDDPEEMPAFLASNVASEDCRLLKVAGNLFAVLSKEISKALKNCHNSQEKAKLRKLNGTLVEFAEGKGHSLQEASKKRPKPQSATFHGAGLVVPYDSKTSVGYRKMPLSDTEMKKLLAKFSDDSEGGAHKDKLQELVTWVHIANDECDYGMGLEFSIALFCAGHASLHPTIDMLGGLAYHLLGREPFARILKAHLKRRLKSPNASIPS
ncbi:histone PARylation factor 1 [Dermacentor silvarum]|uniref:histone PARylation factor 1 n=1 Tax=Dermacentor silvarum TaxID=543639 RepID=UPI0018975017|nr:histone PARylation factor 1 [Dermacentor silvarum]